MRESTHINTVENLFPDNTDSNCPVFGDLLWTIFHVLILVHLPAFISFICIGYNPTTIHKLSHLMCIGELLQNLILCYENEWRKTFDSLLNSEREYDDGNAYGAVFVGCMYRAALSEPVVMVKWQVLRL